MIRACIVGSLPKPSWLAGRNLYAPWRIEGEQLAEAQDDAVRSWLHEQERAGFQIVTDGEQRRRHQASAAPVDGRQCGRCGGRRGVGPCWGPGG